MSSGPSYGTLGYPREFVVLVSQHTMGLGSFRERQRDILGTTSCKTLVEETGIDDRVSYTQ